MGSPPPYSLTEQKSSERRRHSYYPTSQSPQQNPTMHYDNPNNNQHATTAGSNQKQSFLGRTSKSLSYHSRSDSQKSGKRGLGGLMAGLGVASMLNSSVNPHKPSTSNQQTSHSSYPNNSIPPPVEDPLAILTRYDTILLIDDSGSMSYQNRWREATVAVAGLAEALVRYDSDGIDVYFLNSVEHLRNVVCAAEVNRLFERVGAIGRCTPTDVRVEQLLNIYLDRLENAKANHLPPVKPLNLIVITDGQADDPEALAYVLAGFTERLDSGRFPLNQLGVQFIQIGNDRNASKFLQSLDDDLRSGAQRRRDIVDTTPYQGRVTTDFIIKSLLGGINKRIDHQIMT